MPKKVHSKAKSKKTQAAPSVPQRVTGPRNLQAASGFRDRVETEQKWWGYYQEVAFEMMEKYNFILVHPASIEYTTTYTRSLSKNHPLIKDNLLTLLDPRGEHISLRPSMDMSFLRAYYFLHRQDFEVGMPIENWYTIGSVFGENFEPREKFQLYMGVLGNIHPVVDAECTMAAFRYIQALGFEQVQVLINSIGSDQSRAQYTEELSNFYKDNKKDLCDECQKFVSKDPFLVLACDRQNCRDVSTQAPQSVDWLTEEDKEHFIRVLEYLDELEVPYMLSPELVPIEDYYQKTLVALQVTTSDGTIYILARGGRFDHIADDVIDQEIPAMKMIIDLDKCLTASRTERLEIPAERTPQVFFAQLGDDAKKKALSLREDLHAAGIKTAEHFGQDSLKAQLEQATKLKVKYTCILGQKEIMDGTILIRDMDGGIQEEVALDKLVTELKKRLNF